mmetsp:Transcript_8518/g.16297  ORF Transcript_8518/g.16297 Transcript_8518/m.16297 type:complete len:215 (-) Transcript_8518:170-814(-)
MKLSISTVMTSLWAAASIRSVRAFLPTSVPHSQRASGAPLFLLDKMFGSTSAKSSEYPVYAEESVMSPKAHGTSEKPVQKSLRWNCDFETADRICNYNRHYAEFAGYWTQTDFLKYVKENWKEGDEPIKFYDSVTGKLLFQAPVGRSMDAFLKESVKHGWPSFRDEETNWEYVRCLRNGEAVSVSGTHLGHNIPDANGNRYCINLVSVAGQPEE